MSCPVPGRRTCPSESSFRLDRRQFFFACLLVPLRVVGLSEIVYRFLLLIVCRDLGIGEGPESGWLRSVASTSPSRLKRRSTRSTAAGLLHGLARRRRTHSSLDAATRAFDRSRHEVGYSPAGRSSAESHCGRA